MTRQNSHIDLNASNLLKSHGNDFLSRYLSGTEEELGDANLVHLLRYSELVQDLNANA